MITMTAFASTDDAIRKVPNIFSNTTACSFLSPKPSHSLPGDAAVKAVPSLLSSSTIVVVSSSCHLTGATLSLLPPAILVGRGAEIILCFIWNYVSDEDNVGCDYKAWL